MPDDVLIYKTATVECCVARVRAEYHSTPATFTTNFTRQDTATLQRATRLRSRSGHGPTPGEP